MITFSQFKTIIRSGSMAGFYFGASMLAHAVAPNAVDDNLTSSPVPQNQTRDIAESTLIANDTGDGKNIEDASNSTRGAVVTWSNSAKKVVYDPTAVPAFIALDAGSSLDDTFTYRLGGTDGPDSTGTVTMRVNGVNDPPTIGGILSTIFTTNDKDASNTPFTGAVVSDPDTNESLTVTVTLDSQSKGTLTNLNGFVDQNDGSYTYTGTAANATSKLAALNFVPAENRVAPGGTEDVILTVSVSDGTAAAVSDSRTVRVTSINDVPVVTTGGSRNMNDNATLAIFSAVVFTDPDYQENISVKVTYNEAKGSFSGSGFTLSGSGASKVLTISSRSVSSAQSTLRALVFTPVPNQVEVDASENLSFSILADDGAATDTEVLTVSVLSINDAPQLAPTTPGSFSASGGSIVTPFGSVTLTDADFDDLTPSGNINDPPPGDNFTATITLSPSPYGEILSSNFTGSGATYTYTGTRSLVESAIRAARYVAPGTNGAFVIKLSVTDSSGKSNNTSNEISATVTVTQPVPGMSGLVAGQQLADNGVIFPFAGALFNNFGGADRQIDIQLDSDAKGTFDVLGSFVKTGTGPYVYKMTGNSVSATDAVRALRFKPTPNRITGTEETVVFSIKVRVVPDGTVLSTDTLGVKVIPFNDAPTISSNSPEIRINDDETTKPFSTMGIADPDEGGMQSVTVNVSMMGEDTETNAPRAGGGVLSGAAVSGVVFTPVGTYPDTTYTIVGKPADVTTFLKNLVFTPDSNRNAIGQRETVRFTVFVQDQKGGSAQNQNTTVIVTSVNGAPKIIGVPPLSQQPFPVAASGNGVTMPFSDLEVTDEENLTFTIRLDDPDKGTLSPLGTGGFVDVAPTGDGVYQMVGTPLEITTALKALSFTLSTTYVFPAGYPGLATFTLEAQEPTNTTVREFTIYIRERNLAHIVTSSQDSGPGSLREAVANAGNGDSIVFDFPADDFPVTISLDSPLVVERNLSIVGSGVDQLTISGKGSVALFSVTQGAKFTVEQLTLRDGFSASYGGAISVGSGSSLVARYCDFRGNHAGQYGGAIDVYEGELVVENCLFRQNGVGGSIAKAGGAVSVYTSLPCSITNSTFVGNQQENSGGFGGGALYAENADLSQFFHLNVEHCTFYNNTDVRVSGTAILAASAGMKAHVRNNIFADQQGVVLDVLGGGRFDSLGGNIATDETETTYTQGAQSVLLLNHGTDKRSKDPMLEELADHEGATWVCALKAGSPALNAAVAILPESDAPGTDQRGFWRGATVPDIGAFEAGAFKRVNINEIFVRSTINSDFLEFYNPRDSEALDLEHVQLWIDGNLEHTFGSQPMVPGSGFAWMSTVDLDSETGAIELRNAKGQELLKIDYLANFAQGGVEIDTTGQSINRYPRYEGGFIPHQRVVDRVTGGVGVVLTSPGDDVDGSPLSGGNAPPLAVADVDELLNPVYSILASETLTPGLLSNDIEFDRLDTLKITEVMKLSGGNVTNEELKLIDGSGVFAIPNLPTGIDTTIAPSGADVSIHADFFGLTYNPVASPVMIALSEGETVTDVWAYTIRDYDEADAPQSRGADPAKQALNIQKATSYFTVVVTGVNEAPEPVDDAVATMENQALRLLADPALLAPTVFNFGDLDANYQDFDASGNPVTLKPAAPTTALLSNDDDVDNDDDKASILLVAVHKTAVPADTLVTTSELGAAVTLDIRANRGETSIVYDPRQSSILNKLSAGEIATDSFYYSVFDRHGARGVAKVVVTITGVNDVPMARNDGGFVANEDAILSISGATLLANDTDPDQNESGADDLPVIVQPFAVNSALGAKLVFDGTTITYDPRTIATYESLARNEQITDTLTYWITDANAGTSQATVTVVVEGRNDAPVAVNDQLAIFENQTKSFDRFFGILSNDADVDINGTPPDDDPWVIPQRDVITPMGARLDIHPDGSYRYDANSAAIDSLKQGQVVVETFPYVVVDNNRTTASDDSFSVLVNRESVVLPVLANDAVVGAVATPVAAYGADANDANKLVIESPNHSLRDGLIVRISGYSGAGSYNGVYPVTSIDRNHFSVDVPFVDDPPAGRGVWKPWFVISAVGACDKGGQVTIVDGQSLQYTAASGFHGTETFRYTILDGVGGQDVGLVKLNVIQPQRNGYLTACQDKFRIGMGESAVLVDVLANDAISPATNTPLLITGVAPVGSASGSLEIVNQGKNLSYTPPSPGFVGEETFTYLVSGGGDIVAQASVTFEVVDRTNLLSGSDDHYFVVSGSSNQVFNVLANDASLPTFPVTLSLVSVSATSSGGVVTKVGNQLSYTPPPVPFLGTDSFTYTAKDVSGATTTQSVEVQVVADVQNFHAQTDHYVVNAGAGPVLLPVLGNDGVVRSPGTTLSVVNLGLDSDSPPDVGRVSISGGTLVQYTPPAFAGTEEFTYEISNGTIERREARIVVTVVDHYETVPEPENDSFHVAKNSGPHVLDVLLNDIPYPSAGWSWVISSKTNPNHGGSAVIAGDGKSLSYTPAVGFFGTETFSYTVRDAFGDTATATVSVKVGDLLTSPDEFAVLQGSTGNHLHVLGNDDLLDTFAADYSISAVTTTSASGGSVAIVGSGPDNHVTYSPPVGFSGDDSFAYTVTDQTGETRVEDVVVHVLAVNSDRDDAQLRVEITGVNDVPVLTGISNGAITDKQSIHPFENFSVSDLDESGNQLQTVVVSYPASEGSVVATGMSNPSSGTYKMTGTPAAVTAALRALIFTPYENRIDYINPGQADVAFHLSLTDGYIASPILRVASITVTPVNDTPVLVSAIPNQVYQINAFSKAIYLPPFFMDVDDNVLGGQLTWTVSGNTNPGLFDSVTVDPVKRLLVLDFGTDKTGVSDVTIRATDRGGLYVQTTFRVTVEGPPVIELVSGQTSPPAATFVSGTGGLRDYVQDFRVKNTGTLPVEAFIVHVSDLNLFSSVISVPAATFSTNENGTTANLRDDLVSSAGVSILRKSTFVYDVKYNVPIPPGGSVVVHLTYRAFSDDLISIRPTIRISLTTSTPQGVVGVNKVGMNSTQDVVLTFAVKAGREHRLEYTSDMKTWSPWLTPVPLTEFDRVMTFVDDGLNTGSHPSLAPRRFYRMAETTP